MGQKTWGQEAAKYKKKKAAEGTKYRPAEGARTGPAAFWEACCICQKTQACFGFALFMVFINKKRKTIIRNIYYVYK